MWLPMLPGVGQGRAEHTVPIVQRGMLRPACSLALIVAELSDCRGRAQLWG